jgi:hypothetical protein
MKLSPEQFDDLQDLLHHEGIKSLYIEMENALEHFSKELVCYDLSQGVEKLGLLKAKYDGAFAMISALKQRLEAIKRKK